MLLSVTLIAYLAMKTKGFVAPMVVSAALVMGSAAIINQNWLRYIHGRFPVY